VKGSICAALEGERRIRFVGSHPLAGSEKTGFVHADAELFQSRVCVITPGDHTDAAAAQVVQTFWDRLGMHTLTMSPAVHDRRLARTSHLPHLTAAALCCLLESEDRRLTATGFRDTTRIAAGDPGLWRAIFEANADAVAAETDRLIELLSQWRDRIAKQDWEGLTDGLRVAKVARDAIRSGQ
jgi:prephenate dehydrogenase